MGIVQESGSPAETSEQKQKDSDHSILYQSSSSRRVDNDVGIEQTSILNCITCSDEWVFHVVGYVNKHNVKI